MGFDTDDKLKLLANGARHDICGYDGIKSQAVDLNRFIYKASLPQGGCVNLVKVLQTNACYGDCAYCANSAGRDIHRTSFEPDELAKLFMELNHRKAASGLFLSSGICGDANRSMEKMLSTVTILRKRYMFDGYIHLKMLPGITRDLAEEGCRLANRVSVNIEAPSVEHLGRLSSKKDLFSGILKPMQWVKEITSTYGGPVSGQTSQFVVGASGESDRQILKTALSLYDEFNMRRLYFSPYRPVGDPRLEGVKAAPLMRAHRLYQADWLYRVYGFNASDILLSLGEEGNLSLNKDPKTMLALKQPWLFPLDINTADYPILLRVPGIGPVSATKIISLRRQHSFSSIEELLKVGIHARKAAPFLWFKGKTPKICQTSFLADIDIEETLREMEDALPVAP